MASGPGDPGAALFQDAGEYPLVPLLRLGRGNFAPPAFHLAPAFGFLLRLGIETLQLAAALLLRLLQLQLCLGAARALVVGRLRRRGLDALPIVKLLLALLLLDFKLLSGLLLARIGRRRLRGALLLLHAQLHRILLLLPLQLMLLQRPRARIFGASGGTGKARAYGRRRHHHLCPWNGSCLIHERAVLGERGRGNLSEQ
jgi:hypothetical protein